MFLSSISGSWMENIMRGQGMRRSGRNTKTSCPTISCSVVQWMPQMIKQILKPFVLQWRVAQKNGPELGFRKTNYGVYLWQGFSCEMDCLLENLLYCCCWTLWLQQWRRVDGCSFPIQKEMNKMKNSISIRGNLKRGQHMFMVREGGLLVLETTSPLVLCIRLPLHSMKLVFRINSKNKRKMGFH